MGFATGMISQDGVAGMTLLSRADEIWMLSPTADDLLAGAHYASITLPWTFNRMMMNTSSRGQQERALNIAKGIVVQEMLKRALEAKGVRAPMQRKSHRDDDLFDFRVELGGREVDLDVKSVHHYSNYDRSVGREPLTAGLIVRNRGYPGPDWRQFFPMLIPHTQINQDKEAYCFAIASSVDPRSDIDANRSGYALTAFPSGEPMAFLGSKRLCLEREAAGEGFFLAAQYHGEGLLAHEPITLIVNGEWDGALIEEEVLLEPGSQPKEIGPFSVVSSFFVDRDDYDRLYGHIDVTVSENTFAQVVYNSSRRDINVPPAGSLVLTREDFCNLFLPTDYHLFVLGWLTKAEFLSKCRTYTGWVWPKDSINRYENQPWTQVTDADRGTLGRAGFGDRIIGRPARVEAGWMKTTGRGSGACCYVFPNTFGRGGVSETNLYVLPQDLHIMDELR